MNVLAIWESRRPSGQSEFGIGETNGASTQPVEICEKKLWADFLQLSHITDTLFSFQSVEHPTEQIKSLRRRRQYVPPKCQNAHTKRHRNPRVDHQIAFWVP